MSRAWDKAKKGFSFLGKVGMVVGAVSGAIIGLAFAAEFGVTGAVAMAGLALAGAALGGVIQGLEWGVTGGVVGGLYGAVSDEPKNTVVVQQSRVHEMAHEQEVASREFRNRIEAERAMQSSAHR